MKPAHTPRPIGLSPNLEKAKLFTPLRAVTASLLIFGIPALAHHSSEDSKGVVQRWAVFNKITRTTHGKNWGSDPGETVE